MSWEERNIDSWGADPKEGDQIEGLLVRTEPNVNAPEKLFDYILETKEAPEMRVWGSTLLNLQLLKADVGKRVRITFAGFGIRVEMDGEKSWGEFLDRRAVPASKMTRFDETDKAQKGKNPAKQWKVEVQKVAEQKSIG